MSDDYYWRNKMAEEERREDLVREYRANADKPAATGSGEPLLADQRCCACGKRYQEHAGRDNLCYTDGRTLTFKPTPPASQPTVTLGRETFKRVCAGLSGLAKFAEYDHDRRRADELLALLRAAEQK